MAGIASAVIAARTQIDARIGQAVVAAD